MGTDTIGRLDIELSANTAEFIEAFREAADSVRHSKDEITGNFRAIKLASAELDAQLATGGISGSAALTARRNIISLAQQEIDLAKKEGIEHGRNLGYLRAATAEIEKQKNALSGGGQFKGAAADILNAVKLRAANIPGLGGFGNVLAIRAYEPVGKMLEEGAGKLEETFGGAAVAAGGFAAAIAALGAVAIGVTHHMMDLAQSTENEAAATGLTLRQVQELREVAREMGIDAGSLETSFSRLTVQLGEYVTSGSAAGRGSDYLVRTLKQFGVQMEEMPGVARPVNSVLEDFYEKLQKIPDAATRSEVASVAFGTRGRIIAEMFAQASREGETYEQMLDRIDKHGPVISDDDIKQLEEAKGDWDKLTASMEGYFEHLAARLAKGTIEDARLVKNAFAPNAPRSSFTLDLPDLENLKTFEGKFSTAAPLPPETLLKDYTNPNLLNQIRDENEAFTKRLSILKAGGEMQAQLITAEKNYGDAVKALQSGEAIGNKTLIEEKKNEIALYGDQISDLREIISLQARSKDLSKLEAQLEAAEQAYTVAAVEGNKSLTAEKAKQIALYDKEVASLQKSLGLTKELASFAGMKPVFSAPIRAAAKYPATPEESLLEKYGIAKPGELPSIPGTGTSAAAPPLADLSGIIGKSSAEQIGAAGDAMEQLRMKWSESIGNAIPQIQADYDKDLENFRLLYEQKKITAEQFAEAQAELADMTNRKLKAAYEEQVREFGTVSQRMRALLDEIAESGHNFSGKLFDSLAHTVDGIEGALAHLVVTGENSFRQLFQSLAEETLKNTFQLTFSKIAEAVEKHAQARQGQSGPGAPNPETAAGGIAGALGKVFGLGKESDRILGTKENPMYVIDLALAPGANAMGTGEGIAGAAGKSLPALFKEIFAPESSGTAPSGSAAGTPDWMSALGIGGALSIPKPPQDMSPGEPSGVGGFFKSLLGGGIFGKGMLGGLFGQNSDENEFESPGEGGGGGLMSLLSMGSMFAGFLASGGDVSPGKAYIVGENHPEFFVPRVSGHVAPSLKLGGDHTTHVEMHLHGVKDADSFRRSETQIYSNMHAQLAAARSRNG